MRKVGFALCAILVVAGTVGAQVIPMGFAEIVSSAEAVVVAEAIDTRAEWVTTGSSRVIVTRVTFRVRDTLKGTQRVLLPLEFLGGTVREHPADGVRCADIRGRRPCGAFCVGRESGEPDRGAHAGSVSDQHRA